MAVECRIDDADTLAALAGVDHPDTRHAVEVERAFLAELGSGCSLPVGGHVSDGRLTVFLADFATRQSIVAEVATHRYHGRPRNRSPCGPRRAGGPSVMGEAVKGGGVTRPLAGCRVLVTRERPGELAALLEARGATAVHVPLIEVIEPVDAGAALGRELERLPEFDWLVVTSPAGAERVADAAADAPLVRLAVVGTVHRPSARRRCGPTG